MKNKTYQSNTEPKVGDKVRTSRETNVRTCEVEADNIDQAEEKVKSVYNGAEILYVSSQFEIKGNPAAPFIGGVSLGPIDHKWARTFNG